MSTANRTPRPDLESMRSRVGWTQRDAGDHVGRRERMWSAYERGEVPFPAEIERLFQFEVACELDPALRAYVVGLASGQVAPHEHVPQKSKARR